MNIVFYHNNGIMPTNGGVSRITDTLGTLYRERGNNVWFIGAAMTRTDVTYNQNQVFLPNKIIDSEENVTFVCDFVRNNHIDVVVNQAALTPISARFLRKCSNKVHFILISCFHNSILTPIYNGAYQKEYLLKKKGLGVLFNVMRSKKVTDFITLIYIKNYRKKYIETITNSDAIFVLCEGQKKELMRMCGHIGGDKTYIVPNCVEFEVGSNVPKEKIALWVGTMDYAVKRPDYMLQIWKLVCKKHPDWKLQLLGNGPSFDEMKLLASQLNLDNVSFEGRKTPKPYYERASIICITSVHESFSLVTVEAQQKGVVPIAFNSFNTAEILINEPSNGLLVKPFDIYSFADKLSYLMDNADLRLQMSKQSIESSKMFSFDVIYSIWNKIINELSKKHEN